MLEAFWYTRYLRDPYAVKQLDSWPNILVELLDM